MFNSGDHSFSGAGGAAALALLLAGCSSHADYARGYSGGKDYRYASYYDGYSGHYPRRARYGIDAAREAHRLYPEHIAEELDGNCEAEVTILPGETLSDISEYCDAPVLALLDANPQIGSVHRVSAYQRIAVPNVRGEVYAGMQDRRGARRAETAYGRYDGGYYRPASYEQSRSLAYHTVRRGDTLGEIAWRYDVPLSDIMRRNPELHPRRLQVGDRVWLPEYARQEPSRREARSYRAPAEPPVISISPAQGPLGGEIRIVGDNFRRGEQVAVLYGRNSDDLVELKIVEATGDGRIDEVVRLPRNYADNEAYFAVRPRGDAGPVMSEAYRVDRDRGWARAYDGPYLQPSTSEVYRGEDVRLAAEGFPPETPVSIYGGPHRNALVKLADTRSGPHGQFDVRVPVPEAIEGDSAIFVAAVNDSARTVESERVRVVGGAGYAGGDSGWAEQERRTELQRGLQRNARSPGNGGLLSRLRGDQKIDNNFRHDASINVGQASAVSGVLTNEGAQCPTMRDDSGNLFSLLGDLRGFDYGDRVLIRGSTLADNRLCNQGETVQVFTIEEAPW